MMYKGTMCYLSQDYPKTTIEKCYSNQTEPRYSLVDVSLI